MTVAVAQSNAEVLDDGTDDILVGTGSKLADVCEPILCHHSPLILVARLFSKVDPCDSAWRWHGA